MWRPGEPGIEGPGPCVEWGQGAQVGGAGRLSTEPPVGRLAGLGAGLGGPQGATACPRPPLSLCFRATGEPAQEGLGRCCLAPSQVGLTPGTLAATQPGGGGAPGPISVVSVASAPRQWLILVFLWFWA